MNSYWCSECEKLHAEGYKKHQKYKILKKEEKVAAVTPTNWNVNRITELETEIDEIKKVLNLWSYFMERKHPYFKRDEKWKEWISNEE